jgi:hypothetical protein
MNGFTRKLHGGRSEGHSPTEFVPQALVRGTIHEMEHTDDAETAMEIAMDHLIEHPDYYDVIEAMEAQMSTRMLTPNIATAVASEAAVLAREAPAMAQAVRAAAPEIAAGARVVVPRAASWIGRAAQWFREGKTTARVIAMLRESGIPKRAAVAIEEAAKAFLAAELQIAAQKAAGGLVKRIPRTARMRANPGNYVWVIGNDFEPIEGPFGPHSLVSAKTFARISATKGKHARAVSRGLDPNSQSFEVIRIYQSGTGQRLK